MGICEIRFSISSDFQIETFNTGGFHHSIDKNIIDQTLVFTLRNVRVTDFIETLNTGWILSSCFEKYLILDMRYVIIMLILLHNDTRSINQN